MNTENIAEHLSRGERNRKKKISIGETIVVLAMIILLGGLGYAGYTYVEYRFAQIEQSTIVNSAKLLEDIQSTNALNFQVLETNLQNISLELEEIKWVLNEADATIGTSASAQENLSQHIRELEKQMQELKTSMELLKGSAHGNN